MKRTAIEEALQGALEDLARIEHERWSHWQKYMHAKCREQSDGSLLIPAKLVGQWNRQIATPYSKLSENEKQSDREQVQKYLPTIIEALSGNK